MRIQVEAKTAPKNERQREEPTEVTLRKVQSTMAVVQDVEQLNSTVLCGNHTRSSDAAKLPPVQTKGDRRLGPGRTCRRAPGAS